MNELKQLFVFFEQRGANLRPGQQELVKSMQRYYRRNKVLTEKQTAVLLEIKKELTVLNSDAANDVNVSNL